MSDENTRADMIFQQLIELDAEIRQAQTAIRLQSLPMRKGASLDSWSQSYTADDIARMTRQREALSFELFTLEGDDYASP